MFRRPCKLLLVLLAAMMTLACAPRLLAAEDRPLREIIDAEIRAAWKEVTPAGRASDATFLRRVYLDLVGTVPTYEEARNFLQDTNPKKRESLIDRLLED